MLHMKIAMVFALMFAVASTAVGCGKKDATPVFSLVGSGSK